MFIIIIKCSFSYGAVRCISAVAGTRTECAVCVCVCARAPVCQVFDGQFAFRFPLYGRILTRCEECCGEVNVFFCHLPQPLLSSGLPRPCLMSFCRDLSLWCGTSQPFPWTADWLMHRNRSSDPLQQRKRFVTVVCVFGCRISRVK